MDKRRIRWILDKAESCDTLTAWEDSFLQSIEQRIDSGIVDGLGGEQLGKGNRHFRFLRMFRFFRCGQ